MFGDGSDEVLFSPAHSRGEQVLVDRWPRTRAVVFPAGVIPQRANLELRVTTVSPTVGQIVVDTLVDRIKRVINREQTTVIFQHDHNEWEKIKLAPEFYE